LEDNTSAFGATQLLQMCEDSPALCSRKVCQINDDFVEPLLQEMPIDLPQKRSDVKPANWNRSHRIVSVPLRINPVTGCSTRPAMHARTASRPDSRTAARLQIEFFVEPGLDVDDDLVHL
jgi:hypothetical protein